MKALLLTSIQNDFCDLGSSAISGANEIIPIANQLMHSGYFDVLIALREWHPANHISFAANHVFRYPKQVVRHEEKDLLLWSIHCVQDSFGADFSAELETDLIHKVINLGEQKERESFSAFDTTKPKELEEFLLQNDIQQVFLLGLLTEYTIKCTAIDAQNLGFETFIIEDSCRALNLKVDDEKNALADLQKNGITLLDSDQLIL